MEENKKEAAYVSGEQLLEKLFAEPEKEYYVNNSDADADEHPIIACRLSWSYEDSRTLIRRFTQLKEDLQMIAGSCEEIGDDEQRAGELLSPELFQVWQTYVSEVKPEGFDEVQLEDIFKRLNDLGRREHVTRKMAKGEAPDEFDKEILQETADTTVTGAERELAERYDKAIIAEAECRVGANHGALDVVQRARRYCWLCRRNPSDFVLYGEERLFASCMAMHAYGKRIG